jgi:hypothetical protein
VPLAEALSRRWDDDRHVVLYTSDRQYRINNSALGKVRAEVRLLAFDVDNHDDVRGWLDLERPKIARMLAAHPGGFVSTTKRGWRAFYALPEPFPIRSEADKESFALYYARVAGYLFERFGIIVDEALTRWNQPVRLPHVVRDGQAFDAEILAGEASGIGAFELPADVPSVPELRALAAALPRWGAVAKRWQPKRENLRVVASAAFDHVALPPYAECLAAAERWAREEAPRAILHQGGRATARSVAATLHVGFALHREDVERLLTGSYNRRRCSPPWSEQEMGDLRGIARGVARTAVNAWGFMLSRDRTGVEVARATLSAASEARHVVALEEVGARLVDAIEQHRAVIVRATYGAGKTREVAQYIATQTTGRAIVVVSRHELGRDWIAALAAAGESDVAYHASVVQRRDDAGKRHCDNKLALKVYRHAGDVQRDVCPSCPRVESCPAYQARPNAKARVHVLPREMIEKVGVTDEDLVVFDDAAVDLLTWHRLRVRELRRLTSADERILPRVQAWFLRIFLHALLGGPRSAEERARSSLVAASHHIAGPPGPAQALRYVAKRLVEGQRSPRLPLEALAESGDDLAETLRDVSRVRRLLGFAAAVAAGAEVRWSEDARTVHGESAAATVLRTHRGRLVVLDAAANVEELRALRSDWHVERLDVDDAGDTSRLLLFATSTTRTALREERKRRALLDVWLGAVLAHLTARGSWRPVLVVYKAIEAEVRAHPALLAWCAERRVRQVVVTHYGALRGSNRFRRRDAVVTIGDPWLNGHDVAGRAEWLGLDEPGYRVGLATAELGQAHGRLRSVRRRRRRLTQIHVGRLVPDGWAAGVVVSPLGGPPERMRGEAEREEFRALLEALGGNAAAAELLGCSPSAVAGWKGGRRSLPGDVLQRARGLVQKPGKASASSGEPGRGGGHEEMDAPPYVKNVSGCVHPPSGAVGENVGGDHPEEAVRSAPATPDGPGAEPRSPVSEANDRTLPPADAVRSARDGGVPTETSGKKVILFAEVVAARGLEGGAGLPGGASAARATLAAWQLAPQAGASPRAVSGPASGDSERGASRQGAVPPAVVNAQGAARVLAVLEQLAPARASPPPVVEPPAAFEDEQLADLLAAQTNARRKLGLGP